MMVAALVGWLARKQSDIIEYRARREPYPESRRTTASAGHRRPGGQNRPACRRDGPQCDLRRGLSGVLVRISARARTARCAGRALWVGIMRTRVNWAYPRTLT